MIAVELGTTEFDLGAPSVVSNDERSATGAGATTYSQDVTVPAGMNAKAAQSIGHDKETTDFTGAKGAPGLGVPTEAETNTDEENRDKRKKINQH